jgi:predicted nucleic acid-binding protein
MKLLLDTNIVIDILSKRTGYEESLDVLKFCEVKLATGVVTTATVLDVMYILRKHIRPENVKDAVQTLLAILEVEEVRKADIVNAFESDMTDYEDAVQAQCAKRNNVNYIVTRNIRDFDKSPVLAVLPGDALRILRNHST